MPLIAAFILTSAVNYGFSLAASRILSPGDFGLVAFAQSALLLCGFVLQSGVPWSLSRALVPADEASGRALMRGALVANVVISVALALVILLLYLAGPLRHGLEQPAVLIAVLGSLPVFAISAVARAAFQGRERFGYVGLLQAIEVVAKAILGIALALGGLGAAGAVAGFPLGALLASLLGLGLLVSVARVHPVGDVTFPRTRTVAPMFGALFGLALVLNLDLLAVKLFVTDRAAAGQYQAAIILANAPYFLVMSALVPVLFTRLSVHGSLVATRGKVAEALRIGVAVVLPVELLFMVVPSEVLAILFPAAYAPAAPILRLMAVGNAALIVVVVLSAAFQAIDRSWEVGRILLGVAAAEILALPILVPRFGEFGAVSSFDTAAVVGCLLLARRYQVEARIDVRPALQWLGRFGVAVAVAFVLALAVRSVGGVEVGVVLGGALYYVLAVSLHLVPDLAITMPWAGRG